jgi:uncharacterized Zn ribbon protein
MKENLCLHCEHVWYDNGKATFCPNCGHENIETDDYTDGYDSQDNYEPDQDWNGAYS